MSGHWDDAYALGASTRSWYQQQAEPSLDALDAVGAARSQSVIDVGGGASTLVDSLLERGHADVTILDISQASLNAAQARLGARADTVTWLTADLTRWHPDRTYDIWHDRAVFHFLTTAADRQLYLRALDSATHADSIAVVATFAEDGPEQCSGLPVARYSATSLAAEIGPTWKVIATSRQEHVTPHGTIQPFTWLTLSRLAPS